MKATRVETNHNPDPGDDVSSVVWFIPWTLALGEGIVDLGYLAHEFTGSLHESAYEGPDGLSDVWSVDNGEVVVRTLTREEQEALPDLPDLNVP